MRIFLYEVEIKVTLRVKVGQSWCRAHSGTCDQILLPVRRLLSESRGLVSVGHPLWLEDGFAICIAITQWSEWHRTLNHTLLSHLRLPQPGGQGSHTYVPQEQGGPVIPPGTGFPLCCLLGLAGLQYLLIESMDGWTWVLWTKWPVAVENSCSDSPRNWALVFFWKWNADLRLSSLKQFSCRMQAAGTFKATVRCVELSHGVSSSCALLLSWIAIRRRPVMPVLWLGWLSYAHTCSCCSERTALLNRFRTCAVWFSSQNGSLHGCRDRTQAVIRWLPTVAARVQAQVMWDLWWIKWHRGKFSKHFDFSCQFPSNDCFTHNVSSGADNNRPNNGLLTKWTLSHSTPRN
jgi:hypothetical protein